MVSVMRNHLTAKVDVRVDELTRRKLTEIAEAEDTTVGRLIRLAVREFLTRRQDGARKRDTA